MGSWISLNMRSCWPAHWISKHWLFGGGSLWSSIPKNLITLAMLKFWYVVWKRCMYMRTYSVYLISCFDWWILMILLQWWAMEITILGYDLNGCIEIDHKSIAFTLKTILLSLNECVHKEYSSFNPGMPGGTWYPHAYTPPPPYTNTCEFGYV